MALSSLNRAGLRKVNSALNYAVLSRAQLCHKRHFFVNAWPLPRQNEPDKRLNIMHDQGMELIMNLNDLNAIEQLKPFLIGNPSVALMLASSKGSAPEIFSHAGYSISLNEYAFERRRVMLS